MSRDLIPDHPRMQQFGFRTWHYLRTLLRFNNSARPVTIFTKIGTLYQGLLPNFLGATLSWGSYFYFYGAIKEYLQRKNQGVNLTWSRYFLASSSAGLMTLALTNPLWVIKTRMCVVTTPPSSSNDSILRITNCKTLKRTDYTTFCGSIRSIFKSDGIYGFYRGFLPGIFGVTHGGIQFMIYEKLKLFLLQRNQREKHFYLNDSNSHEISSAHIMMLSSFSKIAAALSTYPYQVIRSRLQDCRGDTMQVPYKGLLDVVQRTFQ